MASRIPPFLLLTAALAFACAPRPRSAKSSEKRAAGGPPVAASLDVEVKDGIMFAFHVTNNAEKRMELTFPNGLTHDLVVLDEGGREVWRWSEGRMYTQTLQNRVLDVDETMSYQTQWSPRSAHGNFVAVASLRSENHPIEQRVPFSLP